MGRLLVGLGLAAVGALITFMTYSAAAPGGTYVITYGLIIVGAVYAFQGVSMLLQPKRHALDPGLVEPDAANAIVVSLAAAVAGAGGPPQDSNVRALSDITLAIYGRRWSDRDVKESIRTAMGMNDLPSQVAALKETGGPEFAEWAVELAARVAIARGEVWSEQVDLLAAIARGLSLTGDRLTACIQRAASS